MKSFNIQCGFMGLTSEGKVVVHLVMSCRIVEKVVFCFVSSNFYCNWGKHLFFHIIYDQNFKLAIFIVFALSKDPILQKSL